MLVLTAGLRINYKTEQHSDTFISLKLDFQASKITNNEPTNPVKVKMTALYLATLLVSSVMSVEIQELTVPGVVEEGSENVLLDCNFQFNSRPGALLI